MSNMFRVIGLGCCTRGYSAGAQCFRSVFLNICETATRYILFSQDKGPVPTNLLV